MPERSLFRTSYHHFFSFSRRKRSGRGSVCAKGPLLSLSLSRLSHKECGSGCPPCRPPPRLSFGSHVFPRGSTVSTDLKRSWTNTMGPDVVYGFLFPSLRSTKDLAGRRRSFARPNLRRPTNFYNPSTSYLGSSPFWRHGTPLYYYFDIWGRVGSGKPGAHTSCSEPTVPVIKCFGLP